MGKRQDIVAKLRDLHKQATEERSHYYTGKCVMEAITEITALRSALSHALEYASTSPLERCHECDEARKLLGWPRG